MAMESGGTTLSSKEEQLPDIHVLNFKFEANSDLEKLRVSITDELIKRFGNILNLPEHKRQCSEESDKKNDSPVASHSVLLKGERFQSLAKASVINDEFICILTEEGYIFRAPFKTDSHSLNQDKDRNDIQTSPLLPPSSHYSANKSNTGSNSLQVASDESYARSLQRRINDGGRSNLLAGRRSLLNRSPIHVTNTDGSRGTFESEFSIFGTPILPQTRDLLSTATATINRLSPTLRGARYMPYNRDQRHRQIHRHLMERQIDHLMGVTFRPAQAEQNQLFLSANPVMGDDGSTTLTLPDSITVVGADTFETDFSFPLPTVIPPIEENSRSELDERLVCDSPTPSMTIDLNQLQQEGQILRNEVSNSFQSSNSKEQKTSTSKKQETASEDTELIKLNIQPELSPGKSKVSKEKSPGKKSPVEDMLWIPKLGDIEEIQLEGDIRFEAVTAMKSGFLLVDHHKELWVWYNENSHPAKYPIEWGKSEKVQLIGSSFYRATIYLESKRFVTIYDKCFDELQSGNGLSLLNVLSHDPVDFGDIIKDEVVDIQCASFYTAVQTNTGQAYWWGLTPSCERNENESHQESKVKALQEIQIGDTVSISEESKCEIGAAVFNVTLQKIGTVVRQIPNDNVISDTTNDSLKPIQKVIVSPVSSNVDIKPVNEVWDIKDVIYLHEQKVFHGSVVSFDNPFVIVKCDGDEKLRVCFKKNIVKVSAEDVTKMFQRNNRYHKYIFSNPQFILKDNHFKIAALSVTEIGISVLLNRLADNKAFLSYPLSSIDQYSSWFTCPLPNIIGSENKNFKSDFTCTIEHESVPAKESNLSLEIPNEKHCKNFESDFEVSVPSNVLSDVCNDKIIEEANSIDDLMEKICKEDHFKFSRSFSLPAGVASDCLKRKSFCVTFDATSSKFNGKLRKPCLKQIGTTQNHLTLLFDNVCCFYPIQFNSCLANPPLLEISPMHTFTIFEHTNHLKDEKLLTVIAVPKVSPMVKAIQSGKKKEIDNVVNSLGSSNSKRRKLMVDDILGNNIDTTNLQILEEKCNGNQNIMHVAVSNIMKIAYTQLPNVNIMDSKHDEENYVLQKILENNFIWPRVKKLLCERDSHGCTPFMTAIMVFNVRGAYMILEAVKRDGNNDAKVATPLNKQLFWKAICMPSFSGLTPLHAAIHCSSKKVFSQPWMNTLQVTNLPPNYSSRLLMKLFKSRYPSVYRTMLGLPKLYYPRRTVRSAKSSDNSKEKKTENDVNDSKGRKIRAKIFYPDVIPQGRHLSTGFGLTSQMRRSFNQRSCLYQPKEGVVMFGDVREMFDAMNEMNNFVLLSKSDYPSSAVISVLQHIIQVQQYQEISSDTSDVSSAEKDHPFNKFNISTNNNTGSTSSQENITQSQREGTISKCFDDIMVHFLVVSLLGAEPLIPFCGSSEGESAFSYFVKTYPRFSPSHLHKLFLNWRPCGSSVCKYNRHTGNINITCQKSESPNKEKKSSKFTNKISDLPGVTYYENPILARRGLRNRNTSLKLNVAERSNANDLIPSPLTPSIRLIDNLKFAPIEITSNTGLTPKVMQPATAVKADNNSKGQPNFNPFFPSPIKLGQMSSSSSAKFVDLKAEGSGSSAVACLCHLSKARLLWNTTFEATHFLLAKNWTSIVASVLCYHDSKSGTLNIVESGKLDEFLENLLTNPYSILLEIFVKTLAQSFYNSPVYKNKLLLICLIKENPVNQEMFFGKIFNSLLPWLTLQRFVRALVRQLSLCLNGNSKQDHTLKYKIGRYMTKNHTLKETRNKEHLQLCLKAFSWISIVEILQAANVMLKPILSGTVKGQAKSIIPVLTGQQQYGRVFAGAHNPHIRMHVPASGVASQQRPIIRNAIRLGNNGNHQSPSATSLLNRHSNNGTSSQDDSISDSEDNNSIDDSFDISSSSLFSRTNETNDLNEIDWSQTHGVTPDLAWAVDGHIHLRNEVSSRSLPPPMWQLNQQNNLYQQIMNTPSVHAGYLYLAKMFCALVKEAVDISRAIKEDNAEDDLTKSFKVKPLLFPKSVESALKKEANELLNKNWDWMKNILDSLEKQLKTGEDFDTKHFFLRLRKRLTQNDVRSGLSTGFGRPSFTHAYGSTPEEYMVYLLKEDMGEAEETLPVLDLFSYAHIIYILDAYLYVEKMQPFASNDLPSTSAQPSSPSFLRTKETTNSKFFKMELQKSSANDSSSFIDSIKTHVEECKAKSSILVWLDNNILKKRSSNKDADDVSNKITEGTEQWKRVINAFSSLFITEGPGFEKDSFLAERAGSAGRISRFQNSLSNVRGSSGASVSYARGNSDQPTLLMSVVRSTLLTDCINLFDQVLSNHPFGDMRVRFEGEEGTGPGVNRGLFAAFTAQLKDTNIKFKNWPVGLFEEGTLSQKGIFTPKPGKYNYEDSTNMFSRYPMTQETRYQTFVSIGRFFGLTLWFNQNIPIVLSRSTLLCLLGSEDEICFDDLAYYDSTLYESFSQIICDSLSGEYSDEQFNDTYCFCFEISVNGYVEELCPGGRTKKVTKENLLEYIRLYTYHLLYKCRENELQALRDGLLFMVPKDLLDDLQPEDLQLLLSGGNEDVPYARLRSIITFSNSRGCSRDTLEKYKTWFWKIVMRMSGKERQKLLYFATGSYVLPALDNRVGNNEELSITIDIIGNSSNADLPMASTCGQRISVPLYPSKSVFKHKLLQAIECQTYGLG